MLYVKNAAGVVEEYDYQCIDVDDAEGTVSYASEAFMNEENENESFVLPKSERGRTWWEK